MHRIRKILEQKEELRLEFKLASTEFLPDNLFEGICAMLNREVGDVFLGVKDDGTLNGIRPEHIDRLTSDLVNLSNNPSKLDPPFILHPKVYEFDGRLILHIAVPQSSEVHKCGKIIYDRGHQGDYKVTQLSHIALLYNRKRNYYSEAIIYPALTLSDFKSELFPVVRNLIRNNNANHPWLGLSDEQLLKIAGLYGKDPISNLEEYNLAAVLLFGKDETIVNVLSHFKIDAMVRKNDLFRYDDRFYIQTNLIEAYDQLNSFVEKHLPDKFYLQDDQRISLRSHIFREVIANLIVHREYIDAHPSTFIIYKDCVEIINANNPHGNGLLLPDHFVPFPKNPLIAKFFIQLGRVDELGSGILNVYRYLKDYSPGRAPQFIEDKLFKTIIPIGEILHGTNEITIDITDDAINEATNEAINEGDAINEATNDAINKGDAINEAISIQVQYRLAVEIRLIYENNGLTLKSLITAFDIKRATGQRDMKILKETGYVSFVGSNKNGKYMLTKKGKALFDKFT